ncbi:unnamed protein product [Cuscuta epithymum]|uniref:Uncharacterized protein n=1 Tax=Cuscuta epithymum TaxID=186058 RepID=A0AAV0E7D0_9ASTE|nr:unnamed protein product [Cuscuta epithymum]
MEDIVNSYKKMTMEEQKNGLNFDEEVEEGGEEENDPKVFPVVVVVVTDRRVKLLGLPRTDDFNLGTRESEPNPTTDACGHTPGKLPYCYYFLLLRKVITIHL